MGILRFDKDNGSGMQRYKLTLAYDGTDYAGWQIQPNGVTVQELVERALREITGEVAKVHGSGRTDQGVHARGQVAHLDLKCPVDPTGLRRGLNALLPPDIRIIKSEQTDPAFHARRSARSKEYRYLIWNAETIQPFISRYRAHVTLPLDVEPMQRAAALLVGRNDFTSFSANPQRPVLSNVRRLYDLQVKKRGSEIVIIAKGEGFLYKMARSLAGFLVRVGEGAIPPGEAKAILLSRRRTARVPTAPPAGLFLWNVTY
jgi:tRNA pseudouridine38-40 synthase